MFMAKVTTLNRADENSFGGSLVLSSSQYKDPIRQLLDFGECASVRPWPDYREKLALGAGDVPDLIAMATDPELIIADPMRPEACAPVHAWRALAQLGAAEAVPLLLRLVDESPNDMAFLEVPWVIGEIGLPALAAVAAQLSDRSGGELARVAAAQGAAAIARRHPEAREACGQVLTDALRRYTDRSPTENAGIVEAICGVRATGAIDLVKEVLSHDAVDRSDLSLREVYDFLGSSGD